MKKKEGKILNYIN
jgi:hypothetical protein